MRATTATLDMDATLIETHKRDALFCYKKFKAYQPLNCWWAEQGVMLYSEFRDGNVPGSLATASPSDAGLPTFCRRGSAGRHSKHSARFQCYGDDGRERVGHSVSSGARPGHAALVQQRRRLVYGIRPAFTDLALTIGPVKSRRRRRGVKTEGGSNGWMCWSTTSASRSSVTWRRCALTMARRKGWSGWRGWTHTK